MDDFFQDIKKDLADLTPVLMTKAQEAKSFDPGSPMFWAKHTPSVLGSAISLMLPGLAAAKAGVSMAKALGRV